MGGASRESGIDMYTPARIGQRASGKLHREVGSVLSEDLEGGLGKGAVQQGGDVCIFI